MFVLDGQLNSFDFSFGGTAGHRARLGSQIPELIPLWQKTLFRCQSCLIEARTDLDLNCSGNSAFDQRRRTQEDPILLFGGNKFFCRLGAQDGASHVHQHKNASRGQYRIDGLEDIESIGPYFVMTITYATRRSDRQLRADRLSDEINEGLCQRPAVRNKNEANHE